MPKPNARIARLKAEREAKIADSLARHKAKMDRNAAIAAYRIAKANGTLPPATPPQDIPDIGGYDNNSNPL